MRNKRALYFTKTELGILDSAMKYYTALGWIDGETDSRNKTMLSLAEMIQQANSIFGLKRKRAMPVSPSDSAVPQEVKDE